MGTVTSVLKNDMAKNQPDQEEGLLEEPNQLHAKNFVNAVLDIEVDKPIYSYLLQLQNWSFAEIRNMYNIMRSRIKSPCVNRSIFKHIIGLSQTTAYYIFDCYGKKQCIYKIKKYNQTNKQIEYINIFELIAVMIITSYANFVQKVHLLFLLFDFDVNHQMSLNELMSIFACCVYGFCKATNQKHPQYLDVQKYAKIMFLKSDVSADNQLNVREVIDLVKNNQNMFPYFERFEPKIKIHQDLQYVTSFQPYSEQEANKMHQFLQYFYANPGSLFRQINAQCKDEDFDQAQDFPVINYQKQKLKKSKKSRVNKSLVQLPKIFKDAKKVMSRDLSMVKRHQPHTRSQENELQILDKALQNHFVNQLQPEETEKQHAFIDVNNQSQQLKLNYEQQQQGQKISKMNSNSSIKALQQPKQQSKSESMIIIKGFVLRREDIFRLKDRFDQYSEKKAYIYLEDYVKQQESKPQIKQIANDLFNFIDTRQQGRVDFMTYCECLYPSLQKSHKEQIEKWLEISDRIQKRESEVEKSMRMTWKKKEQIVPHSFYSRLITIFERLDTGSKGYLTVDDLAKCLSFGYTYGQIEKIIKTHDSIGNGCLQFLDFIRVILPSNYNSSNIEKRYLAEKAEEKKRKKEREEEIKKKMVNRLSIKKTNNGQLLIRVLSLIQGAKQAN